jgi:hypothetical protein
MLKVIRINKANNKKVIIKIKVLILSKITKEKPKNKIIIIINSSSILLQGNNQIKYKSLLNALLNSSFKIRDNKKFH